jgi:hypothetical protein
VKLAPFDFYLILDQLVDSFNGMIDDFLFDFVKHGSKLVYTTGHTRDAWSPERDSNPLASNPDLKLPIIVSVGNSFFPIPCQSIGLSLPVNGRFVFVQLVNLNQIQPTIKLLNVFDA